MTIPDIWSLIPQSAKREIAVAPGGLRDDAMQEAGLALCLMAELRSSLGRTQCKPHALKHTPDFLRKHFGDDSKRADQVVAWLRKQGIRCDCQLLREAGRIAEPYVRKSVKRFLDAERRRRELTDS